MPYFRDTVFIYEHPSPIPHMYQCVFNSFQRCIPYRNHSPDLQSKTNDWFLHERPHWAGMG